MTKTVASIFAALHKSADQRQELIASTNALESVFYSQDDRMVNKWHHYLEIYERHLSRYRDKNVRILELGIHNGGSLQMWRKYFGARAVIHGLDIDERCAAIDDNDITVHIGSQDDPDLVRKAVRDMGGVDVVIDDGSHLWHHQINTFNLLYDLLDINGVYICEDTHSSYWPEFSGQSSSPSFIEYAKTFIDRLHAWYSLEDHELDKAFCMSTKGIFFYDSMVVFEKGERSPPRNINVGHRRVI